VTTPITSLSATTVHLLPGDQAVEDLRLITA